MQIRQYKAHFVLTSNFMSTLVNFKVGHGHWSIRSTWRQQHPISCKSTKINLRSCNILPDEISINHC